MSKVKRSIERTALRGFLWFLRLQAVQIIDGALRVGGGGEDRALVFLQHLEPVPQIGGVVVSRLRRDAEVGAEESGSQLGNQFLAGVGVIAKPFAQDTRQAATRASSSALARAPLSRNSFPCP